MWCVQVRWYGIWVKVHGGLFASQAEAEWAIGQWKQTYRCHGDPFRVVEESHPPCLQAEDLGGKYYDV